MEAAALGVEPRTIGDVEIVERLVYALVNEGARVLEEGIAQRASDIDLIYTNGYGFPVARGGPMFYAETLGLKAVHERICEFREQHGAQYWEPAPLLRSLAIAGKGFGGG